LPDRRDGGITALAARFVAVAALGVIIVWTAFLARNALLIIYISVLLAIGFGPIVRWIEHQPMIRVGQRLPRWFAILIVYVVIVGSLTVVGLLVIPPLLNQASELWTTLPGLLDRGQAVLIRWGLLDHPITLEEAVRRAPSSSGDAVGTVALAATRAVAGVFGLITILILTFYLLIESDSLFAGFAHLFPRADRPRVEEAATKITTKVSAWLSGQLMLAGTIGISSAIGLYLLGVPFFYVLALLTGIGEMIPVVGPILSAVPAALVGFTVSTKTGLLVILFFFVQQQVENHVLVPKIMSRQVGVTAVTVIVALLIGGTVLGILGAILAVPSAAILQVVIQELLDERDRREVRAQKVVSR
jgi:predicted PurR-regulated permease PerM